MAAVTLASGAGVTAAAQAANVTPKTIRVWLRNSSAFVERINTLQSEMVDEAVGKLTAAHTRAADTLVALLGDSDPRVRHAAATGILRSCKDAVASADVLKENAEMAKRLTELEKQHDEPALPETPYTER
jgi:hypothetical protein